MALPAECSTRDLADLFSLTTRAVNALAEQGVCQRLGRDRFALGPSVAGYVQHRERVVEQKLGGGDSYASARALKTREQALEAQTRRLEREGRLSEPGSEQVAGAAPA